jgi:hypothetical protein
VRDRGMSGDAWDETQPALDWTGETLSVAAAAATERAEPRPADHVADAFVAVALGRLERDHVALLSAICDLTSPPRISRPRTLPADDPTLREALLAVLREDLRQTQRALMQASAGTYGTCATCHTALPSHVLLEQPATTHCARCAASERASQVH